VHERYTPLLACEQLCETLHVEVDCTRFDIVDAGLNLNVLRFDGVLCVSLHALGSHSAPSDPLVLGSIMHSVGKAFSWLLVACSCTLVPTILHIKPNAKAQDLVYALMRSWCSVAALEDGGVMLYALQEQPRGRPYSVVERLDGSLVQRSILVLGE
jgi:hypothetical protein